MRLALLMLIMSVNSIALAESNAGMEGAAAGGDSDGLGGISAWFNGQKPAPAEEAFTLPAVAGLGNWAVFTFPQLNTKNTFKLSLDSISIGKDNIVRYAVAIQPRDGNVTTLVFEGLDCESNQYRRYASATSSTEWRTLATKAWKPTIKNGHNAWQGYLADDFCRLNVPWPLETIKKDFVVQKFAGDCAACKSN